MHHFHARSGTIMEAFCLAGMLLGNLWVAIGLNGVGNAEREAPVGRVVACWYNRAGSPKLIGSAYLFAGDNGRAVAAAGRLEVQAFDMAPALRGEEPRLLAQWTFDAEALKKLQRKDMIGDGYTVTAFWTDIPANVANIKVQTVYVPDQGAPCSDEPTYLARRTGGSDVVQADYIEKQPKVVQAQTVSRKSCHSKLTLDDIIRLSKNGVADKVILEATKKSDFDLTVDDLIYLTQHGVSEDVILELQYRMRYSPEMP